MIRVYVYIVKVFHDWIFSYSIHVLNLDIFSSYFDSLIFNIHCKYLNARSECNDIVISIYSHCPNVSTTPIGKHWITQRKLSIPWLRWKLNIIHVKMVHVGCWQANEQTAQETPYIPRIHSYIWVINGVEKSFISFPCWVH